MTNAYHQAPHGAAVAPAGCPVDHSWSPLAPEYLRDPYPIASRLRDEHPVVYATQLGYVVVSRMDDIEHVFLDPDVYASSNVQDPVWPLADAAAEILDAPDGAGLRDLVPFSVRAWSGSKHASC